MVKFDLKQKSIAKAVLFTVAYYNAMDYLPNKFFVWRNIIAVKNDFLGCELLEVEKTVSLLLKKGKLIEKNGLLLINANEYIAKEINNKYKEYIQKNKISDTKIRKAKKTVRLVSWIPYLREMLLTGTLILKRGGVFSDWDIITILRKDRIWLGRLFLTLWLQLLFKRRHENKVANRFCLNQFITDDALFFLEQNKFIANELLLSIPLFDNYNLKNKLIAKNKKWLRKIKPNFTYHYFGVDQLTCVYLKTQRAGEIFLEKTKIANSLNLIVKKIMIKRIIENPKTYIRGADIRYGDLALVFLPYPQRDLIQQRVNNLLTKIQ